MTLPSMEGNGKFEPVPVQKSETGETSKEQAKKIAEQMIPLEEKIKLEEEAREAQNTGRPKKEVAIPGIASSDESKRVAHKIAEKAGVSPRTV